jgi:O-antigen/teichoic acid export membrane protein
MTRAGPAAAVTAAKDTHVDRMARAGSRNLAAAAVSGGANVVLVVLVTNAFDRDVSGTLFASTALFLLLVSVCALGTDVGLARWIPRYLVAGRTPAASHTLRVAGVPVGVLSVVVGAALALLAPEIAPLVAEGGREEDLVAALRLLGACLPVTALYETTLAATRAYGTIAPTVVVERLGRAVVQVLAVATVGLLGGSAVALVAAWAAPYVVGLAVAGVWLVTVRRSPPITPASSPAIDAAPAAEDAAPAGDPVDRADPSGVGDVGDVRSSFWRFTAPRSIGQITQVALQRLDIVLVAGLLGLTEAAVYTAATRFLVFGQVGTLAVQQVLQPQLSELLAREDLAGTTRTFQTATAWIMALTWPAYLSFAAIAPVALEVFGDGYGGGATTVAILSLTMLLATAAGPVDSLLLMSGRSGLSLANNVAALAVNVVLNLVLIPHLGITGAAVAWAVALFVRNALPFVQVQWDLGISAVGPATRTVALVTAVPLAVTGPIARLGIESGRPAAAAFVVLGLLGAAAGLWRTREITGVGSLLGVLGRSHRIHP